MTVAEFYENLKAGLDTLRAHKVRTGLTLLGMIIGVTSVISVAAIIEGLNRYVGNMVASLGANTWFITRLPAGTDPTRMPERIRVRRHIEYGDGLALRELAHSVTNLSVLVTRAGFLGDSNEIRAGNRHVEQAIVRGVETGYFRTLPLFTVEFGREFTGDEDRRAAPVCLIGTSLADSLFPSVDPLGRPIIVNGQSCEVIGIFAHNEGFFGGPSVDRERYVNHTPACGAYFVAPPGAGA
jgi:putative ABC transport system permease protein